MRERNSDHRQPGRRARRDERRPFGDKPGHRSGKAKAAPWRGAPRDRDGTAVLYGWHTVKAALENPQRRFHRLLATENAARRLTDDKGTLPIAPTLVHPEDIAAIAGATAVHQGLYAEADPLAAPELEDVATDGIVVVLDQITDPHNFGAILRSAAAFAVTAVVTTERHSPQTSGVLAKAASGALEYVPIVTGGNLAPAPHELRGVHTLLICLYTRGGTRFP